MFRCFQKASLVRRKTSCSILSYFHNGVFRKLFVNGKQRERQLIHVQLVLAYSCPHFVLHFEKERETEIATSAFQNYIWRHFLNVCHTFDISRWSIEHTVIEERLETRDLESITARFITKLLWPLLLQGKFPFAVSLRVVGISRKDGNPPWPLSRWSLWKMLYFIASDRSVIGSWSENVDPGEDWFS